MCPRECWGPGDETEPPTWQDPRCGKLFALGMDVEEWLEQHDIVLAPDALKLGQLGFGCRGHTLRELDVQA